MQIRLLPNSASVDERIRVRAFIVGCPRSGTTLLQAFLASHSNVTSFPESHFFEYLDRTLYSVRWGGMRKKWFRDTLVRFYESIGREREAKRVPRLFATKDSLCRQFVNALDSVTLDAGNQVWIEKTPGHVAEIPAISQHVPGARFVHIIRDGRDVVASLFDVARKNPSVWLGDWSLKKCVDRWNRDIALTRQWAADPGHIVIAYEDLVSDPEGQLRAVCNHLSIGFEAPMLNRDGDAVDSIVAAGETWKSGVSGQLTQTRGHKFETILDAEQQRYVLREIYDDQVRRE